MIITVIVDTSGSMSVMAKNHIVSALMDFYKNVTEINQEIFSHIKFKFVIIDGTEIQNIRDIGLYLKSKKRIELSSLDGLFKSTNLNDMNFIFLTDGLFPPDEMKKYKQFSENYPDMKLIVIAIGADADEYNLKELSHNRKIYHPEDIPQAVMFFLSGKDDCPISIASIEGGKRD
jgi:hypothetical protein